MKDLGTKFFQFYRAPYAKLLTSKQLGVSASIVGV